MAREADLRSFEEDQLNVSIPSPLNARLDALVDVANSAGENTNRREVVSALILSAAEKGEEIAKQVRDFRRANARDAVVPGFDEALFLEPSKRGPGPRPRKRA